MEKINLFTKKAAIGMILAAICIIIIVLYLSEHQSPLPSTKVKDSDDAVLYISELGWECDPISISVKESILPDSFDEILHSYNEIQIKQGFDLSKYAGKEITVYQLSILNYPGYTETVYSTLIVHKSTVIGGDIHAAAVDGFMHTLI